jgi:hypothetical protein
MVQARRIQRRWQARGTGAAPVEHGFGGAPFAMSDEIRWNFWAKTTEDGRPGIPVRDHCRNVGCVAEALIPLSPKFHDAA